MVSGVSVVVPVYKSAESLGALVERIEPALNDLASEFEIILVIDGSPDNSGNVARELAADRPWMRTIDLMRNYGQHNALLCGIRAAKHDLVVTMDDDLQHPPEELHKLFDALTPEVDVVYGAPDRPMHGLWRGIATMITKRVLKGSMGIEAAQNVSALRLFRRRVADAFAHYQSPLVNIDVLLTWGTSRFAVVRTRHDARAHGQSNYSVRMLITHAVNMMTGFSVLPLQWASVAGLAASILGLLLLIFVIGRFIIEGSVVQGFAFLASSIAMFAGVQLFALGILGEYLARVHLRTMDKPAYVVRSENDE